MFRKTILSERLIEYFSRVVPENAILKGVQLSYVKIVSSEETIISNFLYLIYRIEGILYRVVAQIDNPLTEGIPFKEWYESKTPYVFPDDTEFTLITTVRNQDGSIPLGVDRWCLVSSSVYWAPGGILASASRGLDFSDTEFSTGENQNYRQGCKVLQFIMGVYRSWDIYAKSRSF